MLLKTGSTHLWDVWLKQDKIQEKKHWYHSTVAHEIIQLMDRICDYGTSQMESFDCLQLPLDFF